MMRLIKIFIVASLLSSVYWVIWQVEFMIQFNDKSLLTWGLVAGQIICSIGGFVVFTRIREDKGNRYLSASELAKKLRDHCGIEVWHE